MKFFKYKNLYVLDIQKASIGFISCLVDGLKEDNISFLEQNNKYIIFKYSDKCCEMCKMLYEICDASTCPDKNAYAKNIKNIQYDWETLDVANSILKTIEYEVQYDMCLASSPNSLVLRMNRNSCYKVAQTYFSEHSYFKFMCIEKLTELVNQEVEEGYANPNRNAILVYATLLLDTPSAKQLLCDIFVGNYCATYNLDMVNDVFIKYAEKLFSEEN